MSRRAAALQYVDAVANAAARRDDYDYHAEKEVASTTGKADDQAEKFNRKQLTGYDSWSAEGARMLSSPGRLRALMAAINAVGVVGPLYGSRS